MKKLIANKAFPYASRELKVGDGFEAEDRDAETLKVIGHARVADEEATVGADVVSEGDDVAEEGPGPSEHKRGRPKGSKNHYPRRDMTAEE